VPATTPETTYDPAIRRVEYTFVPPKATVRFQEKNGAAIPEIKDDELRAIFREFDLNGDGFIQMNELRSVMVKMGQSPTDEELTAMFNAADKDKDGNIDFQGAYLRLVIRWSEKQTAVNLSAEFMGIARANPLSMSLRSVFEELDVDGDGHITRSELRTAFERMGHSLNDEEIKSIYRQVDVNQDGKINFEGPFFH
jgi:Ca2+-binding EF-hand superfamily protein